MTRRPASDPVPVAVLIAPPLARWLVEDTQGHRWLVPLQHGAWPQRRRCTVPLAGVVPLSVAASRAVLALLGAEYSAVRPAPPAFRWAARSKYPTWIIPSTAIGSESATAIARCPCVICRRITFRLSTEEETMLTPEALARWQVQQFEDMIDHLGPDAARIYRALREELSPAQLKQVWEFGVHVSDHAVDETVAQCDAERAREAAPAPRPA